MEFKENVNDAINFMQDYKKIKNIKELEKMETSENLNKLKLMDSEDEVPSDFVWDSFCNFLVQLNLFLCHMLEHKRKKIFSEFAKKAKNSFLMTKSGEVSKCYLSKLCKIKITNKKSVWNKLEEPLKNVLRLINIVWDKYLSMKKETLESSRFNLDLFIKSCISIGILEDENENKNENKDNFFNFNTNEKSDNSKEYNIEKIVDELEKKKNRLLIYVPGLDKSKTEPKLTLV